MPDQLSGKKPLNANERLGVRVILAEREHWAWLKSQLRTYGKWIAGTVAAVTAVQKGWPLLRSWIDTLIGSGT